MFELFKRKIAVKLGTILAGIVLVLSTLFSLYLNRINSNTMFESLENAVRDTSKFLELAYVEPIWNYSVKMVDMLNEGILSTPEIVAVNVFEETEFFSGYVKNRDGKVRIEEPFQIPEGNVYLKMVGGEVLFAEKTIGRFELFYSDESIVTLNRSAGVRLILFFLAIAAIIIVTVYLTMRRLVINPVTKLSAITQQIAASRDYNIQIEKKGSDEIARLYSGFNEMLIQSRSKEKEREEIHSVLEKSENSYRNIFNKLKSAVDNKEYTSIDETELDNSDLSPSLNMILKTLEHHDQETKAQDWLKTGQNEFSNRISGEQRIENLCRNAITYVSKYIGAQVGTIYVKDTDKEEFFLVGGYAFKKRKGLINKFKTGEGLAGQAALEKEVILFSEIPETYIQIESTLGYSVPQNIVVLPLVYEDDVKGVMELGAAFEFSPLQLEFCEVISRILAIAINGTLANERLKLLFDQTKEQSEQLRNQKEELKATNEELEEQAEILKESEAKLQVQQEELQATNEELEEKTELLENQKEEIEKKNRILQEKRKEVEEKAQQLELTTKYKSEFLANMSHELRTPLNSLLLLAKMLTDNEEKNLTADQIESASAIYRSGQNLLHLINDILDLSKIEAKKIELSVSRVKLRSLTSNLELEFKHLAKEKKLDFVVNIHEGLPESIVTDIHRLEQVVRNLLGNAFKFTEEGSVSVDVIKPDPAVRLFRNDLDLKKAVAIQVSDTGPGIPEDKQHLIFEAFKQVDGSISRRHGGTGLGLAISRELTQLIGGELKLESTLGEGATFTIYLPEKFNPPGTETAEKVAESSAEAGTRAEKAETKIPHRRMELVKEPPEKEPQVTMDADRKVMLIIEDDKDFAGIVSKFFQKKGYECVFASDGESGIKYIIENRPTAVILDIGLPGINGWTVLDELKNNPDTRHIPVHIISAYDDSKEGLNKGAVGYLIKPVSTEDLTKAFKKIENVVKSEVKELLVVEDNMELRNTILKLMQTNDIEVEATGTGEETLELLKKKRFDCMILDLGLPDISGFDLLDKIGEDETIEKPPIIIYTGRDLSQEETEKLNKYSTSIVLKSAVSLDRLLDETSLFMHRVESDMPEAQQKMIQELRDRESVLIGKKVLIVDDDMRNAFALSKFLKSRGMDVSIADNGKKALEILKKESIPDIVLMDIMMPVMDGLETIGRIRKEKEFKDLPILALTAKAMESDREECIKSGANDYLSKPVDISKLLSMLRVWLY